MNNPSMLSCVQLVLGDSAETALLVASAVLLRRGAAVQFYLSKSDTAGIVPTHVRSTP